MHCRPLGPDKMNGKLILVWKVEERAFLESNHLRWSEGTSSVNKGDKHMKGFQTKGLTQVKIQQDIVTTLLNG